MKKKKKESNPRPEIKDLGREYLSGLKEFSHAQMLHKIYFNLYKRKPAKEMTPTQLYHRILYIQRFGEHIKGTKEFLKNKKKKFKWSNKFKNVFKKSKKREDQILVWFLNIKGEIEPPKLYPIYESNMVIIKNRPYQVDPRSFWRMGKYTCQIIKGIDRRPVSNLDYAEIQKRGDSTESDEFLIKAAIRAVATDGKAKKPIDKKIIIIIGIIAVAALVYFMSGVGP